jgi:hypothetical protein
MSLSFDVKELIVNIGDFGGYKKSDAQSQDTEKR